jgi:carboxylesterase
VSEIINSESFFLNGGRTGILFIHGFTGSPASVRPWALGVHEAGYTVSVPRIAGHATHWKDLNRTSWEDMYESVEEAFFTLKSNCDRVFIAGFSVGGALALRIAQIHGSQTEGLILLNPSIYDDRKIFKLLPLLKHLIPFLKSSGSDIAQPEKIQHGYRGTPLKALDSIRGLWRRVEDDLHLVDLPLLVGYSLNDHVVDPSCSITVIDSVSSPTVREVIFEKSFHNVSLDYELNDLITESIEFIQDVLSGDFDRVNEDDEDALIRAEFDSMVSHLSLDESSPRTYLEELDSIEKFDEAGFIPPNPASPKLDIVARIAVLGLIGGPAYIALNYFANINFLGTGPGIGICAFAVGVIATMMKLIRNDDETDDGIIL